MLPYALEPVAPPPALKSRLLDAVAGPVQRSAPVFTRVFWAAAALVLFALVFKSLQNPAEMHELAVNGTKDAPSAEGRAEVTGRKVGIRVSGLPKLPEGRCYQLWHIGSDKIPVPQGIFHTDAAGVLRGYDAMKHDVGKDHLFAITMEPDGGSRSPTMPIYAVAKY